MTSVSHRAASDPLQRPFRHILPTSPSSVQSTSRRWHPLDMRELNPSPSLPQTFPTAAEPPRKRQRTTECELNVATAGTSPASSPGPSSGATAASTHVSMSVSSPTSSWGPRSSLSMSRSGGTHESSDTQLGAYTASSASGNGGAPLCDASRTVAEGSSADAARSSATRQGHSSSAVADARFGDGGRGDVGESPPGMKDGRKGKARAKEGAPSSSSGTRAPQS